MRIYIWVGEELNSAEEKERERKRGNLNVRLKPLAYQTGNAQS